MSVLRVPQEMSFADTFAALYGQMGVSGQPIASPSLAHQLFHRYCIRGYCDQVRGKRMGVNFSQFPQVDVEGYDAQYGVQAARRTIDAYQQRKVFLDPKKQYHLTSYPCTYFTSYWRERTLAAERRDLNGMFDQCERLEPLRVEAQKKVEANQTGWLREGCHMSYGVRTEQYHALSDWISCREGLLNLHMLFLSESRREVSIEQLLVCRYHDSLPLLKICTQQEGPISLDKAIETLT